MLATPAQSPDFPASKNFQTSGACSWISSLASVRACASLSTKKFFNRFSNSGDIGSLFCAQLPWHPRTPMRVTSANCFIFIFAASSTVTP